MLFAKKIQETKQKKELSEEGTGYLGLRDYQEAVKAVEKTLGEGQQLIRDLDNSFTSRLFPLINQKEIVCSYYVVFTILFATEIAHLLAPEGVKIKILRLKIQVRHFLFFIFLLMRIKISVGDALATPLIG